MRILIYSINFSPELTGIGKYTGEMAAWMVNNGHTVEAITAMPYYPEWRLHEAYRKKLWHVEHTEGIKIHRCPLYVPRQASSTKRILHELSFILSSIPVWFKLLFKKKFDVVICITPPFHLGYVAKFYTTIKNVPLLIHVQDLQVDAAKNLGMIKNNTFLELLLKAEQIILKGATKVTTISNGMQNKILAKGILAENSSLFLNWVDTDYIHPLQANESLRSELNLRATDKVILYSGNLGEKQGMELIIEAAQHFSDQPDIYFLIVGTGGMKQKLEKQTKTSGLKNILFFALQPYEKLSSLLATADLHLVLQRRSASDLVMPSKLTSILSAGGCPLVTASPGSSLYEMIEKYQLGILAEPDSAKDLIKGIEFALSQDLSLYRSNARAYAKEFFDKELILRNFEHNLERMLD